jgi:hypothetical protein
MMRLLRPSRIGIFPRSSRLHGATMRAKRSGKSARWGPSSRRRSLLGQAPAQTLEQLRDGLR